MHLHMNHGLTFQMRPARPIICLYVNEHIGLLKNIGVLMMTRRAGKFTPELSVLVATITRIADRQNALSIISRSSNVRPA